MRTGDVVFVGSPADARGFRLAGLAGVTPTREAIAGAVTSWLGAGSNRPALVIISAAAMAVAPDCLAALEQDPDGPIVLVLPDGEGVVDTRL